MAEEATKTPLDDFKERLADAKNQRKIAEGGLSKAKQDLVEVRREYPEKIATAKNTLWHARETLREERKKRKHLAGRRRTLHRQRRRNEAARAKLDARIEKKQHAAAKMEARIREDKERRERLPREGRVRLILRRLLKAKIAYLERCSARTRQTAECLGREQGQLDESRRGIEDEQKDVANLLKDKEREEDAAIEDVEKKRKELNTLTEARKKEEEQAENNIRTARENVREKRQAVWGAASRVNSEALKFPWKRVADNVRRFGRWAGFAGVASCFYAYAVSLGAIYRYFYFHSTGIDIFSYAEPIDFLAPGYSLAAFFILTTGLVTLIPFVFYHLVKLILILPLPLYAETLAAVLPHFAKWVPKTSLFVLCCTVWLFFSLLGAAWAGCIRSPSQDVVWIVTDPPFQHEQKYVRVGSTSKYLFLKKSPFPQEQEAGGGQSCFETITAWLSAFYAEDSGGDESPKPETPGGKSDAGILVVPLSKITCISETTGNGEGLCKSPIVEKIVHPEREPTSFEELVHQYIAEDMGCPPGKLHKSRFFSFAHRRGDVIDKSPEQEPELKKKWKEEIQKFVRQKNDKARKATKWIVYGLASRDGGSDHNNALSRQRAETVKEMMCDASKTSSGTKPCPQNVEVRSLGENHSVTGPESRSAVIAVCE